MTRAKWLARVMQGLARTRETMMFMLMLAASVAFEDLDALDRDLAIAATAIGAQAMPVDRRLRLARCPQGVMIAAGDSARALDVRCPALGWRLRIALVAGAPTAQAPVVRRGDPLTVVSGGAGFRVETSAVATEDGALGRVVRARLDGSNGGSARQISGVVTGPQEISVGRP